jgi:valyl-tRNA synthetase
MDADLYSSVQEAFIRLHDEGIIYRENRLVNWCTQLKTALSNLEVENVEIDGRTMRSAPDHDPSKKYEFGMLTSFAYPVDGTNEEIVVATTRLETMLGDTGVAVHPEDDRYKHLHGKFVRHPFQDRLIPIIADTMVDRDFGTGAVKLTPAHDFNDFEAGKRNKLPYINILNEDGSLNANAAPFEGMKRYDAREAVEKELEKKGLFRGKVPNKMMLPICE